MSKGEETKYLIALYGMAYERGYYNGKWYLVR